MPRFGPREDFHSLSVQDLLEARDHYHVHLSHRENMIGTAIGLYRIRVADPDAKDPYKRKKGAGGPRTLQNTVTRKWSWPCVLVFVCRKGKGRLSEGEGAEWKGRQDAGSRV
jgi:hypothetical protein